MKFIDLVSEFLHTAGADRAFAVTGGAAVHILDSFEAKGIKPVFTHHEQAAALAADAYARGGKLGICVTTTGPGVTNALTGLLCSWQDSVPTIFISGQSRTSNIALGFAVRQSGTQHLNVEPIVASMVKNFELILNTKGALRKIAQSIVVCREGRKGPVWIDIPLDIQLSQINGEDFSQELRDALALIQTTNAITTSVNQTALPSFRNFERPVILLGAGSNQVPSSLITQLEKLGIPIVTTWGAAFGPAESLSTWCGRIGVSGMRGANVVAMQADLLISIGARWGQSTTGANLNDFAPKAKVIICDVDQLELDLISTKRSVIGVLSDSAAFLSELVNAINLESKDTSWRDWLDEATSLRALNFADYKLFRDENGVLDSYQALIELDELLRQRFKKFNYVIDGGGTIVYISMQTLRDNDENLLIIPAAAAPMGTGLPQALGAWYSNELPTICLIGDGSMMFNIQELQTLKTHRANVKVVVFSNNGYASIRSTQNQFLKGHYLGSEASGGLELTSFQEIAGTFNMPYYKVAHLSELRDLFERGISSGPEIIEISTLPDQEIRPRVAFKETQPGVFRPEPLDRMYPEIG